MVSWREIDFFHQCYNTSHYIVSVNAEITKAGVKVTEKGRNLRQTLGVPLVYKSCFSCRIL